MLGAHGGDGGGQDPHRPWWKPSFGCKGSGSKKTPPPPRGAAKQLNVDAAVKKNGGPLPVYYDYRSKTFQPIGDYGAMYKSRLGSLIGNVPQYYDTYFDPTQMIQGTPYGATFSFGSLSDMSSFFGPSGSGNDGQGGIDSSGVGGEGNGDDDDGSGD